MTENGLQIMEFLTQRRKAAKKKLCVVAALR